MLALSCSEVIDGVTSSKWEKLTKELEAQVLDDFGEYDTAELAVCHAGMKALNAGRSMEKLKERIEMIHGFRL